jgi:hypothetical protein
VATKEKGSGGDSPPGAPSMAGAMPGTTLTTIDFSIPSGNTFTDAVKAGAGDVTLQLTKVDPPTDGFSVRLTDAANPKNFNDNGLALNQALTLHMDHPGMVNINVFHFGTDPGIAKVTAALTYNAP